jgi:hypothetical protein
VATVDELMPVIGRLETGGMQDPDAAVSKTGAIGRYQIEPSTAEQYGFDPSQLHDPIYNERVARTIVSDLIKRSGGEGADNARAVLVGYNAGPGRMSRFLANGGNTDELPAETQGYLAKSGLQGIATPEQHLNSFQATAPANAHALPSMWDQISAARAHGFDWNSIQEAFDAKRQEALQAGFSNGDINEAFGLPRTYQWQTPGSLATGNALAAADSNKSPDRTFGQRVLGGLDWTYKEAVIGFHNWQEANSQELAGLSKTQRDAISAGHYMPTAGEIKWAAYGAIPESNELGLLAENILKAVGWDLDEGTKVFGKTFINSVHAVAEHANGQDKTIEEVEGLARESKPFTDFMTKAGKSPEALPAPQAVIDAGAALVRDRPLKAFADTMLEKPLDAQMAIKAIGRGVAETGKTPAEIVSDYQHTPGLLVDAVKRIAADEGGALQIPKKTPYPGGPVEPLPVPTAATIRVAQPGAMARTLDEIGYFFHPETRSAQAWEASRILREGNATAFNENQRLAIAVREYGRAAASLTNEERLDFLTRWQTGDMGPFAGTPLGDFAAKFKPMIEANGAELQKMGKLDDLVENYLAQMWRGRVDTNGQLLKNFLGKSPFLKERVFQTYLEGMKAGMVPKTLNPVEVVLRTLAMENNYLQKLRTLGEMKDKGLLWDERSFQGPVPDGLVRLPREIAAPESTPVQYASGTATSKEAYYVTTPEMKDFMKRAFDPGPFAKSTIYNIIRQASGSMISIQLSMSLFHASMMSAVAIWTGLSKAASEMWRGARYFNPPEFGQGLMELPRAIGKPFSYIIQGNRVIRQALGLHDYGFKVQQMVDALQAGGYHFGQEDWYKLTPQGSFWNSIRGTAQWMAGASNGRMGLVQDVEEMFRDEMLSMGNQRTPFKIGNAVIRTGLHLIPRSVDTAMAFLFGQRGMVQMMKAGAAQDLIRDELRQNPLMDHGTLRDMASRISDSVDNRFGMLQYDNTFWNHYMKSLGPLVTISLGWQVGTFREALGAGADIINAIKGSRVYPTRLAAVAMFIPTVALYHAVYGALKGTWSPEWTAYDYFHPPTGGTNPDGSPQRAALPFYDNEVYKIIADPVGGTLSEFFDNSFINTVEQMVNNSDWMGAAITDPRQDLGSQASDYALFYLKQFEPIMLQNMATQSPQTNIDFLESLLGVRQASEEFNMPDEYKNWVNKRIQKQIRLRDIEEERQRENEESGNE